MTQKSAGEWLKENGHSITRRSVSKRAYQSVDRSEYMRGIKGRPESMKDFVERTRHARSAECIFVPNCTKGHTAKVVYCDKTISAARYMALLTFGAPRHQDAVVRHLCGNGHLSCVNPAHLEWGSQGDNIADAGKHRGCETAQDKINAVNGRK